MNRTNKDSQDTTASPETTAGKARRTADKATAPATGTAKKAADKAGDATSAAKNGAGRAADSANSAVHSAVKGVEVGRQAVVQASGQVAATARTAVTVLAQRKLVAAGVGAGLTALTAASYLAGRRSERHVHGPLTRLTGGRI